MTVNQFALRGFKGLWWEPGDYLGWPALLDEAGYDFFMLCYTLCPETSLRWRQPIGAEEERVIRSLAADCSGRGIELCLAIHPFIGGQSWAPRDAAVRFHRTVGADWFASYWRARRPDQDLSPDPPPRYGVAHDLETLVEKCRLARSWGVRSFAVALDDIDPGRWDDAELASGQLWLVNGLWAALKAADPAARLFVVPTFYWTDGARAHAAYTAALARGLPEGVQVFWTGTVVRSQAITAAEAREAAALFGRKPVVWLNYASNDSFRFALQLPPAHPPAADLGREAAGLMVNPMRQSALTRLHALVMGEYLGDPGAYRHEAAVGRAAERLVGKAAAPWLERAVQAWSAYPDVRTLPDDPARWGLSEVDGLIARLEAARADLDEVIPWLGTMMPGEAMIGEVQGGVARLGLLVEALRVWRGEQTPGGRALSIERGRLMGRLGAVDDETGCDARAVLGVTPER